MRRARGDRGGRRAGLTLVELMLVVGLLAVIVGTGLGLLTGLDPGERAAYGLVQNLVRTAHNTAVARVAPARVRLDPAAGTIRAEALEVVGTWHFESEDMEGARGIEGVLLNVAGAAIVEDGFQGRALSFAGEPMGARAELAIQTDPAFDFRLGFAIDLAVRLDDLGAAQLFDVGGAVACEVTRNGGVKAWFHATATDRLGQPTKGAKVTVETLPGVLRPGRWARLRVVYDRRALRVLADGVELAARFEQPEVWRGEGPLVVGGGRAPLPGAVDSLVVAAVSGEERAVLPDGVRFAADVPREIVFAPGGALDPARHPGPVSIGLEFESGRTERIQVNLYGTVE